MNRYLHVLLQEEMCHDLDAVQSREEESVHDFIVKDTTGNDVSLSKYKGQVLIIVNIASRGPLVQRNYDDLKELYEHYKDQDLKILAFPCNQFLNEMPEHDGFEIMNFLKEQNAEFGDVFAKVKVNGKDAALLYQFLKEKQGGFISNSIKWNFTKFLVDKSGIPVDRFAPTTPMTDYIDKIDTLLL